MTGWDGRWNGGRVASLIDKTHSGRQAVKAKQPWQLIGSSSCQVPLGNRLKPQIRVFIILSNACAQSVRTYLATRRHMTKASHVSESKFLVNQSFCSLLSQGLGGKPGPRGQRGPTVGIPTAHQIAIHVNDLFSPNISSSV